jgi:hypothetical protein
MALSSDEIIKREIIEKIGHSVNGLKLLIYPQSSNDDQKIFPEGLTFGVNGVAYGSCDACWIFEDKKWTNPFNNKISNDRPIIALEGTDALNRGSSGNAQYQRFHHVLGAVKSGLIGVYYLRKGKHKIQEDLFGMAYFASKTENGIYLIMDNLDELKELLTLVDKKTKLNDFIRNKMNSMHQKFKHRFDKSYKNWEIFAEKRSTILKKGYVIKFSGRMRRNFTDGSQRAGHIAVGEMFLTKYFFPEKFVYYLWPKMTKKDMTYLDRHKGKDKEWRILRHEKNVKLLSIDDLDGVPIKVKRELIKIKDKPLKGEVLKTFKKNMKIIKEGLVNETISVIS